MLNRVDNGYVARQKKLCHIFFRRSMITKENYLEELAKAKANAYTKEIKEYTRKMKNNFSRDEHISIVFCHLLFVYYAFDYIHQAKDYAKEHRLIEFKKLGKLLSEIEQEYIEDIRKDLKEDGMNTVKTNAEEFQRIFGLDFTKLYFAVNSEIKKKVDLEEPHLMTLIICALLMIKIEREQNEKSNELIRKVLGKDSKEENVEHRLITEYYNVLNSAIQWSELNISLNEHNIKLACDIIRLRTKQIKFNV